MMLLLTAAHFHVLLARKVPPPDNPIARTSMNAIREHWQRVKSTR